MSIAIRINKATYNETKKVANAEPALLPIKSKIGQK